MGQKDNETRSNHMFLNQRRDSPFRVNKRVDLYREQMFRRFPDIAPVQGTPQANHVYLLPSENQSYVQ